MGRKPKELTDEQRSEVETLAALLSQDQIADYFGITRPTFSAMMQRDEDISLRYKRGKARAIGSIAKSLIQKARDGDNTCMIFYLKTQAGWAETQRLEHSGPDGGPIQTEEVSARDILADRIALLASRSGKNEDTGGSN